MKIFVGFNVKGDKSRYILGTVNSEIIVRVLLVIIMQLSEYLNIL